MDNKEKPKTRRPLPTPGVVPAQRPNTPIPGALNASAVAPASFYGTTKPPIPPTRSGTTGSSHTTFIRPDDPPAYAASSSTPAFREPELVTEEPMDSLSTSTDWAGKSGAATFWSSDSNSWPNAVDPWEEFSNKTSAADTWGPTGYDQMDYMSSKTFLDVTIDGRDDYEERNWWDPALREKESRPGPGMLPTVLAEELHNPDHSLFSVIVTLPEVQPSNLTASSLPAVPNSPSLARNAWGSPSPQSTTSSPPGPSTSTTSPPPPPPTESEVRTAVPHPNAYYCPKENGWVILSWKSSSVSPPLAKSFKNSKLHSLPDQARRRRAESCTKDQPISPANKTHHFHKYAKAVDAHKLTPPLNMDDWEVEESIKVKHRSQSIVEDIDITKLTPEDLQKMMEEGEEEEEGRLLDLYVCCQCSFYCIASGVIPGVIPRRCFDEFIRDKRNNPQVGKTGEEAILIAFETLIIIIENKLWKGENRLLPVTRPSFRSKLGWNDNFKRTFSVLGFTEEELEGATALRPPVTDTTTAVGKINRRKLLRAWVEVNAWLADFKRTNATKLKNTASKVALKVKIDSAREMYQTAIGAHPDQIPRGELTGSTLQAMQNQSRDLERLGLTPVSYSSDLLAFAYFAQVRCDPACTVEYFTSFSNLVQTLQACGTCPASLQEILATERSRDRFTMEDLQSAAAILGFGPEGSLGVEYEPVGVDEGFVEKAWNECVKKSWRDPEHGSATFRTANEALRMLAEARGSETLRRLWQSSKDRVMTPEKAYDTLEIPADVDDFMLITVYNMRMDELPSQFEKMREAMTIIAEARDSQRLREFLEHGRDPGEIVVPISPELPRGLNQLGNTCYLNSLLQYFYTIKDLREAVIPMSKLDLKSVEDEKFSDDDLKRHRVGGRLVTRREIVRSRKFINQLAELFFNLEYAEAAAVTPSIDLAKLALVTSRDEDEDEADKGGTDSSNDTDATLVDDAPARIGASESTPMIEIEVEAPQSPTCSPNSILGKRSRDVDRQPSLMDLDSPPPAPPSPPIQDISSPSSRLSDSPPPLMSIESPPPMFLEPSGSSSQLMDVDMRASPALSNKPPPLPPRKSTQSDSVMMFGKQHDVAECMDNCMFQIETALLKFDGHSQGESSDKTSVVKRLFYGKLKQRLTGNQASRSSTHEKEDLFSHLPVNVTADGVDIYDGLSGYFDDVVDFDGEKRRMEVSLVDLPPLLQIQLQRVQFNRKTLQPYKSQAYVKFGETIYMDRFMDNANPYKKAQSKIIQAQLSDTRERIRILLEGKDGTYLSSLEHTSNFMAKMAPDIEEVDDDLLYQLNTEQALLKTEIVDLQIRADQLKYDLEALWRDNTEHAYELTSVFIHRGSSPSFGHYFFYSRHLPENPDSWFKYNDSDVSVVSKDEVLADTTGSTANPYLLVFARKGSEVVDTVKRFTIIEDNV